MDPLRSAEAQGVEFALLSHTVGHSIQLRVFWQCTPQTLTKPIIGGTAKAGASSMGTKGDGSVLDSTPGRWVAHLGNYYKIPPLQ